MLQYWNFNTSKRTFGRFGWTLLKGNSATQAGATAWHANSTLQHKSPSCASHAINTLDLTSRIEATYCRFTVVEKKRNCIMFFHMKTAKTFGIWQRHARSPTWAFFWLYAVQYRCVCTPSVCDFRCRFYCFQTITCRPVKASSIVFGTNMQTQTCREINKLASWIWSRRVYTLCFILLHPVVPHIPSGSRSSSRLVKVGIRMLVYKTNSINLRKKKVEHQ